MNRIFKTWLIVPTYLILVLLGSLIFYLPDIYDYNRTLIFGMFIAFLAIIFVAYDMRLFRKKSNIAKHILTILLLLLPIMTVLSYQITTLSFQNYLFICVISFFSSLGTLFILMGISRTSDPLNNPYLFAYGFLLIIVNSLYEIYQKYSETFFTYLGKFLQSFTADTGTFITVILSLVLLCATLSLLAFTYILTLNEGNNAKKMKKNGEYFFSATILSIISFLSLSALSLFPRFNFSFFVNLNSTIPPSEFIYSASFVFLLVISLITGLYSIIYVTKGGYSTSKLLNINWGAN